MIVEDVHERTVLYATVDGIEHKLVDEPGLTGVYKNAPQLNPDNTVWCPVYEANHVKAAIKQAHYNIKHPSILVLDHGSISLVNSMANDREIAETAWVSTGRCEGREDWEVERLIKFMARENHWTALAQTTIKVDICWPLFVARQAMRSNVGIVYNEESRRHMADEVLIYKPTSWHGMPPKGQKQGRGEPLNEGQQAYCDRVCDHAAADALTAYNKLLKEGVSYEEARVVLPVNMYTNCIATFSLVSAARFCTLRDHPHAQWEIQQYAKALGELIEPLFPIAWPALMKDNV